MSYKNRHRDGDVFNLNLTPLLDVVLQLITFFMMLIHFGTKLEGSTKSIRLPVAPAALPGADLGIDRLVVGLDRTGRLMVRGRAVGGQRKPTLVGRSGQTADRGARDPGGTCRGPGNPCRDQGR